MLVVKIDKSEWFLLLLLVVNTEFCLDSGFMVKLVDVIVGCKDRFEMGWMIILVGIVLFGV